MNEVHENKDIKVVKQNKSMDVRLKSKIKTSEPQNLMEKTEEYLKKKFIVQTKTVNIN